jgi:hypothetical protein
VKASAELQLQARLLQAQQAELERREVTGADIGPGARGGWLGFEGPHDSSSGHQTRLLAAYMDKHGQGNHATHASAAAPGAADTVAAPVPALAAVAVHSLPLSGPPV